MIADLYDYMPTWVRVCLWLGVFLIVGYVARPYIYDLSYLSKGHISVTEPTVIDRLRAFKEYVRYSYRSARYDGVDSVASPLVRNRALIKGVDKDGGIHLEIYTINGRAQVKGWVADVEIYDAALASSVVKKEVVSAVVVDTYKVGSDMFFVIWLPDGTPLNEVLILSSAGKPIKTPPTNIVNRLFKKHYQVIAFN